MGGHKNVNFRLKISPQAKKMIFLDFDFLLHIYPLRCNFFVFTEILYLQPFREIIGGGGQKKRYINDNDNDDDDDDKLHERS